jgi:glycosyltransferase involved in cell wall biosynthesis
VGKTEKVELIYNVAPKTGLILDDCALANRTRPEKKILFVGQISPHKGVDLLVNAATEICRSDPEFHFDILGGSRYTKPFEDSLVQRVFEAGLNQQIVFHGHVKDPTDFYLRSTVLAVPSVFEEPAANVVLEAKRMGLPAIVFPSGGLPELLTQGKTGVICSDRMQQTLQLEIVKLCNSTELLCEMRSNCFVEYEQRFSEKRFDEQWRDIFVNC